MSKDPLTLKQRKFVDEYLKTGNGVQAALAAYGSEDMTYNTAGVIAHENLNKPKIVKTMAQLLDEAGVTDEKIAEKIKEGFEAVSHVVRGDKIARVPDYNARHRYVRTALEVKEKMPNAKLQIEGDIKKDVTIRIIEDTTLKDVHEGELVE